MIRHDDALAIVLEHTPTLEAVDVDIVEAEGAVLAEDVASDVDLPPFDKSAMDGYAVRAADVASTPVELDVIEEIRAGVAPTKRIEAGTCAKIMTGAPVPAGADAVVMVENTEPASGGRVRIVRADPAHADICARGEDVARGATVLEAGHPVRRQEVGLLASVGRRRVRVHRRPSVAVLATGDELVDIEETPGPGQIRDANSWSLLASCRRAGVTADHLGVARDTEADLRAKIAEGLRRDVLLVSGGVSMGDWDLVPGIFREAGVTTHFETVAMKPGKPTVFATRGRRVIFGLPGNPVSTLVAFRLFVWPAVRKMMGHPLPSPPPLAAMLVSPLRVGGRRTRFAPVTLRWEDAGYVAEPVPTHGSADLVAFCRANALAVLEPGAHEAGSRVPAVTLDL